MTTYEAANARFVNYGEERVRLWRIEKQPEVERKYKDMIRDKNAVLGQRVREILRRQSQRNGPGADNDYQFALMDLCETADREDDELQTTLAEGVEVEVRRIKRQYTESAMNHPDELDPSASIRERIRNLPSSDNTYCSPVLVETLLWEGIDKLPNTHPKRLEFDFPARLEALLEFHCIAFHADIAVLKQMYDEDLANDRVKRKELLSGHKMKMEHLMEDYAKRMRRRWEEEKERLRDAQESWVDDGERSNTATVADRVPAPVVSNPPSSKKTTGARKRARMADPPMAESVTALAKPAAARLVRSILKNRVTDQSGTLNAGATTFSTYDGTESESSTFVEDLGFSPGSFFQNEIIKPEEISSMLGGSAQTHRKAATATPPQVGTSRHRASASTSGRTSHERAYEIFTPSARREDDDDDDYFERTTPRAFAFGDYNNVQRLPEEFRKRVDKGKGKAKAGDL